MLNITYASINVGSLTLMPKIYGIIWYFCKIRVRTNVVQTTVDLVDQVIQTETTTWLVTKLHWNHRE